MSQSLEQGVTGGFPAGFDGLLSHLQAVVDEGEIEPLGKLLAQALFLGSGEGPFLSGGLKIYPQRQCLGIKTRVIGVKSRRHDSLRLGKLPQRLIKVLSWPEYPQRDTGVAYPPLTAAHHVSF